MDRNPAEEGSVVEKSLDYHLIFCLNLNMCNSSIFVFLYPVDVIKTVV